MVWNKWQKYPGFERKTRYKKQKTVRDGEVANNVLRIEDNAFIPFDNNNTDYQEYLAWLAEGNTPQEAE